ncbi:MAG: 2-amino-4-oxopentanoate thiolase subunit OrtA [Spirochaetota bacterium]|nr:2-amino-4-oxopentanoate thiolase subunit OrtA [Spirochaetota bacterium]
MIHDSHRREGEAGEARKGDWVQIHRIILPQEERAERVPEDTRKVPLEMWMNGFLVPEKAAIGDEVEIRTAIGRSERGVLLRVNPGYEHSFGKTVPELLQIGVQLRSLLREAE